MAVDVHDIQFRWASERHLRISFDAAGASPDHARIHQAMAAIKQAKIPGLLEITSAYETLLLEFASTGLDEKAAVGAAGKALTTCELPGDSSASSIIEIPVCYDPSCGPDIEDVARFHDIDVASVVRLHSQAAYVVQFIGFTPGFGYLSGLPDSLATPRLETPRVRVPAGSVGIAGNQTGIYPSASAGGWRLIGRTPLVLFDAGRDRPSLLTAGDSLRFVPIDRAAYDTRVSEGSKHG